MLAIIFIIYEYWDNPAKIKKLQGNLTFLTSIDFFLAILPKKIYHLLYISSFSMWDMFNPEINVLN